MKKFNTNTINHAEYLTPPDLIKSLGEFDLDPCSPVNRPWDTAKHHFDVADDGLNKEWSGRVWLNPPYGREAYKWVEKLSDHGNGIALLCVRTDNKLWHDIIFKKADSILFLKGRIKFYNVDGTQQKNSIGAPCCLVAFGRNNRFDLNRTYWLEEYKKELNFHYMSI